MISHDLIRWARKHRYIIIFSLISAMMICALGAIYSIAKLYIYWSSTVPGSICRGPSCITSDTVAAPTPQVLLWIAAIGPVGTLLTGLAAVGTWNNTRGDRPSVKDKKTSVFDSTKNSKAGIPMIAKDREEAVARFIWDIAVRKSIDGKTRLDATEKLALFNQGWTRQALAIIADDEGLDVDTRVEAIDGLISLNAGSATESLWKIAVDGDIYDEARLDATEKLAQLDQDWAGQALAIIADDESLDMSTRIEAEDRLAALNPD